MDKEDVNDVEGDQNQNKNGETLVMVVNGDNKEESDGMSVPIKQEANEVLNEEANEDLNNETEEKTIESNESIDGQESEAGEEDIYVDNDEDFTVEHTGGSDTDDTLDLDVRDIKPKRKRRKKIKGENKTSKKPRKERTKSEPKEPKPKKIKSPKKKEIEEKVPKPWINVKLDDHPDKFTIERVESFERKNRGSSVYEYMYSCLVCRQFKSVGKEVFEDHLEQHVNKVYECSKCNYISFSNADIIKHKQACLELKKEGREYVCHLCGCKLYSRGEKVTHMGSVHNIAELACRFCDELFTTKHLRKKHYRTIHTSECQFCKSCNMGLSNLSREEYEKHVQGCTPGHQCQVCGKLFQRKQGLDHHVTYTHLKVRKFKCTLCPYTATTPDKLKLHVLAHNG